MENAETNQLMYKENAQLKAQNAQMAEQISLLKQQLDWFKRQIFGRKSEKRILDIPKQQSLFQQEQPTESEPASTTVNTHKRQTKKQRSDNDVNETGLRFDDSVPTKIIDVPAPQL